MSVAEKRQCRRADGDVFSHFCSGLAGRDWQDIKATCLQPSELDLISPSAAFRRTNPGALECVGQRSRGKTVQRVAKFEIGVQVGPACN